MIEGVSLYPNLQEVVVAYSIKKYLQIPDFAAILMSNVNCDIQIIHQYYFIRSRTAIVSPFVVGWVT